MAITFLTLIVENSEALTIICFLQMPMLKLSNTLYIPVLMIPQSCNSPAICMQSVGLGTRFLVPLLMAARRVALEVALVTVHKYVAADGLTQYTHCIHKTPSLLVFFITEMDLVIIFLQHFDVMDFIHHVSSCYYVMRNGFSDSVAR